MSDRVIQAGIKVILVQIDEAHSSAWPMALTDQPEPNATFQDRIDRANEFVQKYNPPYNVYIDGWNNQFANTFRAWPDKYHCVNRNLRVTAKAEYGTEGDREAVVVEDYCDLLEKLIDSIDD